MKYYIAVANEASPRKDNLDAIRCAHSVQTALGCNDLLAEICFIDESFFYNDSQKLNRWLQKEQPSCIFNLFEGFSYDAFKEIEFVRALEQNEIPFTGNSSKALDVCLNKSLCKTLLREHNIDVPKGIMIKNEHELVNFNLKYPVFVKPSSEDASVGIDADSLCPNEWQLRQTVRKKLDQFKGLIIEEFIDGIEYNIAFTGNYPFELLALSQLDYSMHANCLPFISYQSKWEESSDDYKSLNFDIMTESFATSDILIDCQNAGRILGCKGYFRVDAREKNGKFYLLDINPNPDINFDSGFIRQAKAAGFSYQDIIKKIFLGALHAEHRIIAS